MTDTQMLNAILDAYTNWQATIGEIPNTTDCLDMTDEQYDAMMDGYKKEIAKLEHDFFKLIDEAVDRAWRNATFDEAANTFECTKQTIYVALKRGHIRGCKISKIN